MIKNNLKCIESLAFITKIILKSLYNIRFIIFKAYMNHEKAKQ